MHVLVVQRQSHYQCSGRCEAHLQYICDASLCERWLVHFRPSTADIKAPGHLHMQGQHQWQKGDTPQGDAVQLESCFEVLFKTQPVRLRCCGLNLAAAAKCLWPQPLCSSSVLVCQSDGKHSETKLPTI